MPGSAHLYDGLAVRKLVTNSRLLLSGHLSVVVPVVGHTSLKSQPVQPPLWQRIEPQDIG